MGQKLDALQLHPSDIHAAFLQC